MNPLNQFKADDLLAQAITSGWRRQYNEALWDWLASSGYTQDTLNDKLLAAQLDGFDFSSFVATFSPLSLFASSEVGVWYDPSDFFTMYQDSAGTTAVTAVGQPVGLILDKSKGLVLGAELLVGAGSATSPWAYSSDVITRNGATAGTAQSNTPATAGVTYLVAFTVSDLSGDTFYFRCGGVASTNIIANGNYTFRITATSASSIFQASPWSGTAGQATITINSIKAISGYHATQTTSAARPILRQDASGHYYLDFDGVDDFLVTSSIDFTATDKMSVFAGVTKDSDAAVMLLVELSSNSGGIAGTFGVFPAFPANAYTFRSQGITAVDAVTATVYPSPITNVLTCLGNILGDSAIVRVNGVQAAIQTADQGVSNYSSNLLYIGRRAGASLPLNGRIYSLIVRGALSDATEIDNAEAYVAGKTGVTL